MEISLSYKHARFHMLVNKWKGAEGVLQATKAALLQQIRKAVRRIQVEARARMAGAWRFVLDCGPSCCSLYMLSDERGRERRKKKKSEFIAIFHSYCYLPGVMHLPLMHWGHKWLAQWMTHWVNYTRESWSSKETAREKIPLIWLTVVTDILQNKENILFSKIVVL